MISNNDRKSWFYVIINKFGLDEGGWCSRVARGGYGMGLWKAIRKEWEGIRCRSRFIVGNGRKVKFWKDLWCKDQTLKEAFPNLYWLAVNKDEWVSNAWEGSGELGCWNPHFSRHFNDWELEEVESLFWKFHPLVVRREVEDALSWKESRDDIFSVRFLYLSLMRAYSDPFPWGLFGGPGLLWGWAFLLGKHLGTEIWPSTSSKKGDGICWIGATCVKRKRKLVII